ncbi:hypothetical protein [Stutzerimonas stutzeri]
MGQPTLQQRVTKSIGYMKERIEHQQP